MIFGKHVEFFYEHCVVFYNKAKSDFNTHILGDMTGYLKLVSLHKIKSQCRLRSENPERVKYHTLEVVKRSLNFLQKVCPFLEYTNALLGFAKQTSRNHVTRKFSLILSRLEFIALRIEYRVVGRKFHDIYRSIDILNILLLSGKKQFRYLEKNVNYLQNIAKHVDLGKLSNDKPLQISRFI